MLKMGDNKIIDEPFDANIDETKYNDNNNEEEEKFEKYGNDAFPLESSSPLTIKLRACLSKFYEMMNELAVEFGMKKTNYASAHGMYVEQNVSTASDVAKLCHHAMKNPLFKEIVKTDYRESASSKIPGHIYKWQNTNLLLKREPNCTGIKTGITWAAGPCLAASMKQNGFHLCIVLLSCCSPESRWYEIPKLSNWGVKKLSKINNSKLRGKMKKKIIKNFTYI